MATATFKVALGNNFNNTSGTTLVITTTAAIAVGDLVVVRWAADNLSATTPTATCADSGGNTYTVLRQAAANATAAAGIAGGMLATVATVAVASGGTITLTFSGAIVGKAAYAESFTNTLITTRVAAVGSSGTTGTAATSGASAAGLVSGDLCLGFSAVQTRTAATGDSDTTNGTWSTKVGVNGGATTGQDAGSVQINGQYKVVNATGAQTYDNTVTSTYWLTGLVVLQAVAGVAVALGAASGGTSTVTGMLGLGKSLAGQAVGTSTVTGDLTVSRPYVANSRVLESGAARNLEDGTPRMLESARDPVTFVAQADGTSTATGSLSVARPLAGQADGIASITTPRLDSAVGLVGASAGVGASTTPRMDVLRPMAAGSAGVAAITTPTLAVLRPLAAQADGVASITTPTMVVARSLAARADGTSTVSAPVLNSAVGLVGASAGVATLSAPMMNVVRALQSGSPYSQVVLADSPWGYWKLDGVATDQMGLHNATPDAGVTWENGRVGQCARIHGGTELINVGAGDLVGSIPAMSLEAWFNLPAAPPGVSGLVCNDSNLGVTTSNWFLRVQASGAVRTGFYIGGVLGVVTSAANYCDGAWHHVVSTKVSGGAPLIYVDGVLVATGTTSTGNIQANASSTITLGHFGALTDAFSLAGPLDECAIYTYALAPASILAHYQSGSSSGGSPGSVGVATASGTLTTQSGGPVALAGQADGTSTVTGSLVTALTLAGSSAGVSTLTPPMLNVARAFSAEADGLATVTAAMGVIRPLAAQADGIASITPPMMNVARALAAQVAGTSTVVGTNLALTVGLAGASAGVATTTSALGVFRPLAGQSDGTSTVTGTKISALLALAGQSVGVATATALNMTLNVGLSGASAGNGVQTAVSMLSVARALQAVPGTPTTLINEDFNGTGTLTATGRYVTANNPYNAPASLVLTGSGDATNPTYFPSGSSYYEGENRHVTALPLDCWAEVGFVINDDHDFRLYMGVRAASTGDALGYAVGSGYNIALSHQLVFIAREGADIGGDYPYVNPVTPLGDNVLRVEVVGAVITIILNGAVVMTLTDPAPLTNLANTYATIGLTMDKTSGTNQVLIHYHTAGALGAPGGSIGTSTASGTLGVGRGLAAASVGTAGATAVLNAAYALAGQSNGVATAVGSLPVARALQAGSIPMPSYTTLINEDFTGTGTLTATGRYVTSQWYANPPYSHALSLSLTGAGDAIAPVDTYRNNGANVSTTQLPLDCWAEVGFRINDSHDYRLYLAVRATAPAGYGATGYMLSLSRNNMFPNKNDDIHPGDPTGGYLNYNADTPDGTDHVMRVEVIGGVMNAYFDGVFGFTVTDPVPLTSTSALLMCEFDSSGDPNSVLIHYYKAGGISTGATLPVTTGLAIWLDASQLALANGANVSPWPDLSGLGHDGVVVTDGAGTPPTLRTNALNGQSVVRLTTSMGRYRIYNTGVTTDWTLAYITRVVPGGTNGRIVGGIYPPNNVLLGNWTSYEDVWYDAGFAPTDNRQPFTNNWKLYSAVGTSGTPNTDRCYSDGVLQATITTAAGFGGTMAISGYDSGTSAETGDYEIAEICFYSRSLSDVERGQVESYLRTKWLTPGGGSGTVIPGSAGTSTVTGELTVNKANSFGAFSSGLSTVTGALSVVRALAAESDGVASLSNMIGVTRPLAGQADGTSTAVGTMAVSRGLSATSVGSSTVTGAFQTAIRLAGQADGVGVAPTTVLAVLRALSASSDGTSTTASAALTRAVGLQGLASGVAIVTGAFNRLVPLAGASAGVATVTGDFAAFGQVTLAGSAAGAATVTGTLSVLRSLVGQADGRATVTADLVRACSLAGQSDGVGSVTGVVRVALTLTGRSDGVGATVGSIRRLVGLQAASVGLSNANGDLDVLAAGAVQWWDGTTWRPMDSALVWNGTTWKNDAKVWDGARWQKLNPSGG